VLGAAANDSTFATEIGSMKTQEQASFKNKKIQTRSIHSCYANQLNDLMPKRPNMTRTKKS